MPVWHRQMTARRRNYWQLRERGEDAGAEEEAAADTENLAESTGEGDGLKNLAFVENIEIASLMCLRTAFHAGAGH